MLSTWGGGLAKEVRKEIRSSLFIFNNQVELLNVGIPFQVAFLLELCLRVDEDQRVMINVHNGFLTQDVVTPLLKGLH